MHACRKLSSLNVFLQLQQAEMEEVRQREANLTALAAIGPRKKKKPNEDAQVWAYAISTIVWDVLCLLYSINSCGSQVNKY